MRLLVRVPDRLFVRVVCVMFRLCVCVCVCLSVCLSVCLAVCLSVFQYVSM